MQSPAEPAALQRLRPVWPQQQACRVEQGSAAEGRGHIDQMLQFGNGRGMPFRDLSRRSQAQIKEEIPESLSYSPSPASVSFLHTLAFLDQGMVPLSTLRPAQLGLPRSPAAPRKVGETPFSLGACGDEWGWGALLGSLGRHRRRFEQVKGIRADLHPHPFPPLGVSLLMGAGSGLLGPLLQIAPDCKFYLAWSKSLNFPGS